MGIRLKLFLIVATALTLFVGCQSASYHKEQVANTNSDRLTVGTVQREIRVGMTTADVVQVLGSPNMVTTDEKRRENWVYDKISTERAYSTSSGGVSALVLGGVGGGGGAGFNSGSGATSTTQRTLTIIIKFDEQSRVRDFAYRSSSF